MNHAPKIQLKDKVTLKIRTETLDDLGQPEFDWQTIADVPAQIKPLRGSALIAAQAESSAASYTVTIRWRNDVTELETAVEFGGNEYQVIFPSEPFGTRKQWLELLVGKVRDAG